MSLLARVFRLVAANLVPGGGFLLAGWSPATALTLYWFDNILSALAMGARIFLHRRFTGAAGHNRPHIGATYSTGKGSAPVPFRSFLAEFLVTSVSFTVGHGIFLAFVLGVLLERPDVSAVRQGAMAMAVCHAIALTLDAWRIQDWPFARLRHQAVQIMSRVILVHVAILGGMLLFAYRGTPGAFFSIFVWLKLLSDIGSMLPQYDPREPPRLLVALMNLFPKQKGESFEDYWRRTKKEEEARAAQDEQES